MWLHRVVFFMCVCVSPFTAVQVLGDMSAYGADERGRQRGGSLARQSRFEFCVGDERLSCVFSGTFATSPRDENLSFSD